MKYWLLIASLFFGMTAFAAIDTTGLTAEQANELAQRANAMRAEPAAVVSTISSTVREEAEAWGELGENMGKAIVGAAREVGVAASDFAETPLGKIVVFLAVYKIAGESILGVIVGLLILIFGFSLAIWLFTTDRWSTVKYEYDPILWGLYKKRRKTASSIDSDIVVGKCVAGTVVILLSLVVGLNCIF